jgi:hypothetical protein
MLFGNLSIGKKFIDCRDILIDPEKNIPYSPRSLSVFKKIDPEKCELEINTVKNGVSFNRKTGEYRVFGLNDPIIELDIS